MAICGSGSHNAIRDKKGKFERSLPDIKEINVTHYLEDKTKGTSFYGGRWLKNKKSGKYEVVKKIKDNKRNFKQTHDGQFCTMPKDIGSRTVYASTKDRKNFDYRTEGKVQKAQEYEKGRFSNPEALQSVSRKYKKYDFAKSKRN